MLISIRPSIELCCLVVFDLSCNVLFCYFFLCFFFLIFAAFDSESSCVLALNQFLRFLAYCSEQTRVYRIKYDKSINAGHRKHKPGKLSSTLQTVIVETAICRLIQRSTKVLRYISAKR